MWGTHVKDVTEISKFLIINEESVSLALEELKPLHLRKLMNIFH